MPMRTCRMMTLILFVAAGFCVAQDTPPDQPKAPEKPGNEATSKPTRTPPRRPSGAGAGRLGDPKRQLESMTKEIGLDEAQQAAIKKLLETRDADIRKAREVFRQSPKDIQRMKDIRDAMRAARDANDPEAMEAARKQAEEMREERKRKMVPARKALGESDDTLHDGILQTLREDQKKPFEEYWKRRHLRRRPSDLTMRNPRALKALVLKLPDLTPEQKEQVDALFKQYQVDGRAAAKDSGDPAAAKKAIVELRKKLFRDTAAVLTPQQQAVIHKQMRTRAAPRTRPPAPERGAKEPADGKDGPGMSKDAPDA